MTKTTTMSTQSATLGNPGLTCSPSCLKSTSGVKIPSTKCPSYQDAGLCGLLASINVQPVSGYSMWNCTTLGATATNPCSPLWNGVGCFNNTVVNITLSPANQAIGNNAL